MRIAFMSTIYPFRGGIAQFNADLYEELSKQHEVKAFTFSCQYPSFLFPGKTQYVTDKDKAKVIDSEAILNSINPFSYVSAARKIAVWKPDLVIMRYWLSYLAPSLGCVAAQLRRKGIKVISILDNVIPHEPQFFDKPFAKFYLKQMDGCIAMSETVLNDMKSLSCGMPYVFQHHPIYDHFGERIGRDTACTKLGIGSEGKNILYFGLIRDYKGLDLLIDAFDRLDESYNLIIAGECYGSFDKYQAQIESKKSKERIHLFTRYIEDNEVPVFFSAADICALTYRSATQSGIAAVALHFDVPMVATRTGGLEEIIGRPGAGEICETATPEAIAEAITKIYRNGLNHYKSNIAEAKREMNWPAFAEAVLKLYQQCCPDGKSGEFANQQ